jgi:zinc transporter ZupT
MTVASVQELVWATACLGPVRFVLKIHHSLKKSVLARLSAFHSGVQ